MNQTPAWKSSTQDPPVFPFVVDSVRPFSTDARPLIMVTPSRWLPNEASVDNPVMKTVQLASAYLNLVHYSSMSLVQRQVSLNGRRDSNEK